jgi:hypothetical protein
LIGEWVHEAPWAKMKSCAYENAVHYKQDNVEEEKEEADAA